MMRILFVFVFLLGLVSCGEKNGEYESCQVYHSYKKWDWYADGTKDGFFSDVLKKYKNDTICSLLNYKNNKLISRKVFANGKLIIEQKDPVSEDLFQIASSEGAIVSGDFQDIYYGYCLEFNKNGDTIGMYEINDSITQLKKIWSEEDDRKLIIKFHKRKDISCIESTGYKETVIFTKNHFNKYGEQYLYRVYDENGKIDRKRSGYKEEKKNTRWIGKYIEPYDKWTFKKLNINPNNWNKHGK